MRLHELFEFKLFEDNLDTNMNDRVYDPSEDEVEHQNLADPAKPKLTLRMINRLKKMRATTKLEMLQKQEVLGTMYANPGQQN